MPKSFLIKKGKEYGNSLSHVTTRKISREGPNENGDNRSNQAASESEDSEIGVLKDRDIKRESQDDVAEGKNEILASDNHKNGNNNQIEANGDKSSASFRGGNAKSNTKKGGRYVCGECSKSYATSSNLSRHKQTHRSLDGQLAKRCEHCGKAYVSMPALAMHLLTHKLHHKCEICGKAFSRPWLLQGHKRSHTGERPYTCKECDKSFADRSNLRAHMQTHSPLKEYRCDSCDRTFALKSYLNKHAESACVRTDHISSKKNS